MSPPQSLPRAACETAARPDEEKLDITGSQRNALRRLLRCLFAEGILDKRRLIFSPHGRQAFLPLWKEQAIVLFEDLQAAPADTFINHGAIARVAAGGRATPIETHEQLIDALRGSFDFSPTDEGIAGLKSDIANSVRNDARARRHREAWRDALAPEATRAGGLIAWLRGHASVREAAMLLDQWGSLEGHPYYPTWKSKPGLSDEEVTRLSPEFNARVPVRIAALRADMAAMERMPHVGDYPAWFAGQFPALWSEWKQGLRAKGLREGDWLPLPIHGWHLESHVKKAYAQEIEDGILLTDGPDIETLPTMSFRTMLPAAPDGAPFIKLPVALWMTSEQRSLQAKSIRMGPRISTVIQQILAAENGFGGTLEIFPEEVAFHYRHAVRQEDGPGKHLSVVYRASEKAFGRQDALLPVTVAALFTRSPVNDRPIFTELVEQDGRGASPEAARAWFRQYARTVARPVIAIYLLYGIGLEAHQQNTQLLFSPDGMARALLVRDFGDGRTYAPLLAERGLSLAPYVHPGILPTVFEGDIEPVRTFILDACFVSHLHEVALALTAAYGLDDTGLWRILREESAAAFDAVADRVARPFWATERSIFLTEPWPTRSLLRMHLRQYSDYRLQHTLSNPLADAASTVPQGGA